MINFIDYYILNEMVDTTESGMQKTDVSDSDRKIVDEIVNNKDLPEVAEDGKAYVVRWADGRGIFACSKKDYLKTWLEETGSWADIVSIKYTEPIIKGKKLKVRK